ncbi:hypothetical protein AVEN_222204-1, partial [Araneus ventricosus]
MEDPRDSELRVKQFIPGERMAGSGVEIPGMLIDLDFQGVLHFYVT